MAQTVLNSRGWTVDGVTRGRWTLFSDRVSAAADGITTDTGTINTLTGNDTIYGTLSTASGSEATPVAGVFVTDGTTLNLGYGDDQIIGVGPLDNSYEYGIRNEGIIDTGIGNDRLEGTGNDGIFNGGLIATGDGNDQIIGNGVSFDLVNRGTILMGAGRDTISGLGPVSSIFNSGVIDTGDGNDIVDALTGGFTTDAPGTASVLMGKGNDILKGFGAAQNFDGGAGTDGLIFLDGVYTVVVDNGGFDITPGSPGLGDPMQVKNFENIGGTSTSLGLQAGTYTIAGGVISYTP